MQKKRAMFLALAFVLIPTLTVYAKGKKESADGGGKKAAPSSADIQYAFYSADSPASSIGEGSTRKVLAHTDNLMVCELTVATGVSAPAHSHPEEQISYIVSGKFEFTIGDEETVVLGPGDSAYMPGNMPHVSACVEEGVMLDIFTPERKDLLPGFDASATGSNKAADASSKNAIASNADIQYVFYAADRPVSSIGKDSTRTVLAHTDNLMVCELNVATGISAPPDTHPQEQISYIVSGKFDFTIGDAETVILGPGDSAYMPGNMPHISSCVEKGVMVDIFTPERKDLLPQ